jgi:hypothetical protein
MTIAIEHHLALRRGCFCRLGVGGLNCLTFFATQRPCIETASGMQRVWQE